MLEREVKGEQDVDFVFATEKVSLLNCGLFVSHARELLRTDALTDGTYHMLSNPLVPKALTRKKLHQELQKQAEGIQKVAMREIAAKNEKTLKELMVTADKATSGLQEIRREMDANKPEFDKLMEAVERLKAQSHEHASKGEDVLEQGN